MIVSDELHSAQASADAFSRSGASLACLCGADAAYAEAPVYAQALSQAGAVFIALAGRPGELESDLRAASVSAFIHVGSDIAATLESALKHTQ